MLMAVALFVFGPQAAGRAQDYSVVTASNAIIVTDLSGNGDALTVGNPGVGLIEFVAAGRTFSVDGGPLLTNGSGGLIYTNALNRITVNAGAGDDSIQINGFPGGLPTLEINGGSGNDTVHFNGGINFAPGASLVVDLQDDAASPGEDAVHIANYVHLVTSGAGGITIRCSRNVVVDNFASLESQDGALTVEANQQATPTTGEFIGVRVRGSVWVYGEGALTVRGRGGTSAASSQHGIFVEGATASIYGGYAAPAVIEGTSGASPGDFNYGVGVQGYDGEVSASIGTGGGDLHVTGIGVGADASRDNIGVALYFGGGISMWNGGDVTVVGIGGSGTGGYNNGVDLGAFGSGAVEIYNEFGAIHITGVAGAGANSEAVTLRDNAYLYTPFGEVTPGGPITIVADSFRVSTNSAVVSSGGEITLRPNTAGVRVEPGSPDAPGVLGLTDEELDRLTANTLTLGGTNHFPILITAPVSPANASLLGLVTAGMVADAFTAGTDLVISNVVVAGQLAPGGADVGMFSVNGNVTLASNSTFIVGIQGTTPGVSHDQLSAAGAVNIGANVALVAGATGEGFPAPGSAFTLVARTGGGGAFAGLPEGGTITNFLGSGINAHITYVGGDGDDVVITMAAPEIGVQQPAGTNLPDGDNLVNFGPVVIGSSRLLTFTVTNSGNGFLNLPGFSTGGANPGEFVVGGLGTSVVAPGESTTFNVTFTPAGLGPRSATLQIFNDDPDEGLFDIFLTGLSIEPPVTIVCPSNVVASVATGADTIAVTWPDPVAMGTPTPDVTCVPPSGSLFPVGVTTVLCTAVNSEWTNSCTFTVTVCATNITVLNTNDAGPGSLRQAIADACPQGTVDFAPGLAGATLTLTSGEIAINKDLTVRGLGADQLAVSGNSQSRIFRIGNATVAIESLALINGHATDPIHLVSGGAIWNEGHLTLAGCALSNNVARGFGGAVAGGPTASRLVISNSTFNSNTAMRRGGAVAAGLVYPAATVTLDQLGRSSRYTGVTLNSATQTWAVVAPGAPITFQADYVTEYTDGNGCPGCITQHYLGIDGVFNDCHDASFGSSTGLVSRSFSAPLAPGAYYISQTARWWFFCGQFGVPEFPNDPALAVALLLVSDPTNFISTVTVHNSTFCDNSAGDSGGALAVEAYATARLVNSTIAGNSANLGGGLSVAAPDAEVRLRNVIVAGNAAALGADVFGVIASEGHNLIGNAGAASGFIASDLLNTNALLGPLQANGGPTLTRALPANSPAVDAGDNAVATAFDQRGLPRVVNGIIDIGAYEADPGMPPMIVCPADIVVSNAPGLCGAVVNYSLSVTGVPAPVVTASLPSGSFFPVGTNLVFCEASNALGTVSCSFTVTVLDVEPPAIIVCPDPIVVAETFPGAGSAIVNFPPPVVADNCGTNLSVTFTPPSGSLFPVGTTNVLCAVVDAAGNSNTCVFPVTVLAYTTASALPSPALCPGDGTVLATVPSGSGPFTFAWTRDGAPLPGATNASLALINVTAADAGAYCVTVTGALNSVTNCGLVTVKTPTAVAPLADQSVCPGATVQFSALASGAGPFGFTWRKDGVPIAGATNAMLNLGGVVNASAGVYSVVVSGACNAVTNTATLTVWTNISFAAVPPVTVPPGTNVALCSPAAGTGPIAYQWFRAGQPIAGATNACLTLVDVTVADEGDYCVVAGGFCSTATNCVTLSIQRDDVPPRLVSAAILCAEDSAGLTRVQVNFSEPMDLVTALNPANYSIAGLSITNVQGSSNRLNFVLETAMPFLCGYNYLLQMSLLRDVSGEFLTAVATNLATQSLPCCNERYTLALPAGHSLVANQLVWRSNRLADVLPAVPAGTVVRLLKDEVRTNATTTDGYPFDPAFDTFTFSGENWSGNPVLNPGAGFFIYVPVPTNLTFQGVKPEANLPVPFRNSLEIVSCPAPIAAGFQEVFGAPPVEGMAVFRLVTTNEPTPVRPPAYQRHLFRNGAWEGGAPSARVGEAWLAQAIAPIIITTNPVSLLDRPFGSTAQFTVSAIGAPPLQYQWRRNGVNLPGETNATLTLTNLQLLSSGNYSVAVANAITAVESAPATLTLFLPDLPMTNNYAERVVLLDASGIGDSSNFGATKEPGEPNHAGRTGGKSMWIDWQAPASGIVVFSTVGSTFDTLLAAYTNGVSGLVEVASDEDSGEYLTSEIVFSAVAGRTYSIAVDGYGAEEGVIVLSWELEPTAVTLPIITSSPQSVVVGEGDNVTFKVAAQGVRLLYQWFFNGKPLKPSREEEGGKKKDLKLKNVEPEDVGLYFVRIYTDVAGTASDTESDPLRRIPPGTPFIDSKTISLQINGEGLARQVRQILAKDKLLDSVTLAVPGPANELTVTIEPDPERAVAPAASVQRSYTGTQIFNTYGAVKQPGEPNHCGIPGGASQWYLYEPPDTGTAFINTDGSSFDTVLAVYTGPGDSFATLVSVACDNNSGSNGLTSRVSFPAQVGTPYLVVVDGVNAATGIVKLNYALLKPFALTNLTLLANGDFRVQGQVTPEVPVTVQRSTNYVNWVNVITNLSTNGSFQYIDTSMRGAPRATYRLIQKP
jgi:hypothetical protein